MVGVVGDGFPKPKERAAVWLWSRGWIGGVVVRLATTSHDRSIGSHLGVSLKVQVAQHFVRAPATNKFYDVGVHFGTKEGHSTTGT